MVYRVCSVFTSSSQGDFYVQHPKPSQKQQLLTGEFMDKDCNGVDILYIL